MGAIPKDPTEFAAMLIGAFIGLIYTVSGWKGSGKDTQLSQDPRIKNLLWAVGGLFAVLMADWQKLFSTSTNIDKGRLFAFYAFSMLLVSALTLFFFCLAIRKEVNSLRKKLDIADLPDPTTAIMNYIHFGYSSHSEHMEKLENSAVVALAEKYRRLSSRVLPVTIAAHANAIERLRKEFSQQFYDTVVDTMLQAMASIVKEWADNNGNLVVNCNLMVAKPYSEKSAADDHELQYRWGDENRYGHILTLTNYADPRGRERFSLPVEKDANDDKSLPGAPEAFLKRIPVVIANTTKLEFGGGVDTSVQKEIKKYFSGKEFKSFMSLIIPGTDGEPVGIVNIETNKRNILGADEADLDILATCMQPFCSLLASAISAKGKKSGV